MEATVVTGPALKVAAYGTTLYVNNLSGHLMAEAQNSPNITANYIWGPDRVLTKKEVSGGEYYYLYNGHGDVIQIVDRNGNVVNNYQYDEWGNNPLSLNLYSYCYNNPLLFTDPSGNTPWTLDPEKREAYSEAVKAVLTGLTVLFVGDSHPKNEKRVYQTSNTVVATPCPAPPNPNNGNNKNKKDKESSKTVPDKASDIANKVKSNNGAAPKGYKGGREYKNIPKEGGQKLPSGNTYKEYDVNPYTKGVNRGEERIVIGNDGSVWYTNDHYTTFIQIE